MTPSPVRPSWRAPMKTWHRPVHTRERHAEIPTAHGTYTLLREPGPRLTADAKAEAWERWQFVLDGDTVLEIDDAGLPGEGMRRRVRHGIHGRLDGVPFTARAEGRSLRPSRRGIRFALDDGRTLSFTVHRFHRQLVRAAGGKDEVRARTRTGLWEADRLDRAELALLCLVTVAGLDRLLASPLQEVL
ncbi:hypothetical protein ADK75_11200 [Streptomyces virginiae]|uniref:Uncharacterized protein n=1 Tax=Streptomyces virginiae TaxID=1961 RepID=A0A0L8MYE1_STRVG|nr:hypothetical protein [Streptomyces virginiae]KOG55456.1 hypothetical protein ADK75_11200 [Streptomyces virginiae]